MTQYLITRKSIYFRYAPFGQRFSFIFAAGMLFSSTRKKKSMEYFIFVLTFIFLRFIQKSDAHLNLYMYKEDLKKDLGKVQYFLMYSFLYTINLFLQFEFKINSTRYLDLSLPKHGQEILSTEYTPIFSNYQSLNNWNFLLESGKTLRQKKKKKNDKEWLYPS